MKKDFLNKQVLNLLDLVELEVNAYLKDGKPEHLHQLRVGLKKTKAIVSFAKKIYQVEYSAVMLKPLFKGAGAIREIQIHLHLLNKLAHPPQTWIAGLKKKEDNLIQAFIKKAPAYIRVIKKFKTSLCLPEQLPPKKHIKTYLDTEKTKARALLKTTDREDLHLYRIKIKKMLYVYHALPGKLQKQIKLNIAHIDQLQIKLGQWHDTYAAIQFLTHTQLPKNMQPVVDKLMEKEKKQWAALVNKKH